MIELAPAIAMFEFDPALQERQVLAPEVAEYFPTGQLTQVSGCPKKSAGTVYLPAGHVTGVHAPDVLSKPGLHTHPVADLTPVRAGAVREDWFHVLDPDRQEMQAVAPVLFW